MRQKQRELLLTSSNRQVGQTRRPHLCEMTCSRRSDIHFSRGNSNTTFGHAPRVSSYLCFYIRRELAQAESVTVSPPIELSRVESSEADYVSAGDRHNYYFALWRN